MERAELQTLRRSHAADRMAAGDLGWLADDEGQAFLQAQSSGLDVALRDGDRMGVARAVDLHNHSHECWLALIAGLERRDRAQLVQQVAALYIFHGRVAGALERCARGALPLADCADVRRILRQRLRVLTQEVTAQLGRALGDTGEAHG